MSVPEKNISQPVNAGPIVAPVNGFFLTSRSSLRLSSGREVGFLFQQAGFSSRGIEIRLPSWLERKRCPFAFWLLPGWRGLSPCPGFGNQPEIRRLDFANHALDELARAKLGRRPG